MALGTGTFSTAQTTVSDPCFVLTSTGPLASNNNTSGNGYPGTLARSTSLAKRSVQRNLGRKNSVSSIDNTGIPSTSALAYASWHCRC